MNRRFALIFVISMSVSLVAHGQTPARLNLYDNFDGSLINPAKWISQWQCGSPSVMECERDIRQGQLHLRVRGYGIPSTNQGNQYGVSELYLSSSLVTDIATQVTVQQAKSQNCQANTAGAHSQALLFGAFFNGGGGTQADDVQAYLQLDRYSTDPRDTVEVGGFLYYQGQFFGNVDLGPINLGEAATVELLWDRPNHRFVVRLWRPDIDTFAEQFMPYSISDTTEAASPFKGLSARVFPVNCVGSRPFAEEEVSFDNVRTN